MERIRFIKAGGLIDGSGQGLRRDVTVAIENGLIVAIEEGRQPPLGATTLQLPHCLLLPPLVDASLLLTRSPSLASQGASDSHEQRATLMARHLGYCHAHGVLGMAISDHPQEVDPGWREMGQAKGLLELRAAAPSTPENGGDFLRLCLSADIDAREPEADGEAPDRLRLLAPRRARKLVMVANGPEAVAEALDAGCDAIEQGYAMGEDNLKRMADRGVLWIPSLVRAKNGVDGSGGGGDIACRFSQRYVAPGKPLPGAEAFWKKTLAGQLGKVRRARSLGVPMALGTGAGNTGILHGESLIEEMKLFVKAGFPLSEIFHAASQVSAEFFAMRRIGHLAVGQPATLLIARGSLQQLPRNANPTRQRRRCELTGRPRGNYRKFKLCRVALRQLASTGQIPGMVKSSW